MIKDSIKIGDWVKATNKEGYMVVGQACNNCGLGQSAILLLAVASEPFETNVTINVNFWDVEIVHKNLI